MFKINQMFVVLLIILTFNFAYAKDYDGLDYKKISTKGNLYCPFDYFSYNTKKYDSKEDILKMIVFFDDIYKTNDSWNENKMRQAQFFIVEAKLLIKVNKIDEAVEYYTKYLCLSNQMKKLFKRKVVPTILPVFLNHVNESLSAIKNIENNYKLVLEQRLKSKELENDKELNRDLNKKEIEYINQYYEAKEKGLF